MAADVAAVWRGAQLDYAFRVTIMDDYEDFAGLTRRALDFALLDRGLDLDPQVRAGLVSAYDRLPTFPDVAAGLAALAAAGTECVLLSNGSPTMLAACLRTAGLAPWFSHVISVDDVRVYKPHPAVYRHAAAVTGRPVESIRLVSCNPSTLSARRARVCAPPGSTGPGAPSTPWAACPTSSSGSCPSWRRCGPRRPADTGSGR